MGKSFQVLSLNTALIIRRLCLLRLVKKVFVRRLIDVRERGEDRERTHDELQKLINKRVEGGYSTSSELDIKKHLEQLRVLYSEIPQFVSAFEPIGMSSIHAFMRRPNSAAPQESFQEFVITMIEAKKAPNCL